MIGTRQKESAKEEEKKKIGAFECMSVCGARDRRERVADAHGLIP